MRLGSPRTPTAGAGRPGSSKRPRPASGRGRVEAGVDPAAPSATAAECSSLCRVVSCTGALLQAVCSSHDRRAWAGCAKEMSRCGLGKACSSLIEIAKTTLADAGQAAAVAAKQLHQAESPGSRLGAAAVHELEGHHDEALAYSEQAKQLSQALGAMLKHLEVLMGLVLGDAATLCAK